MEWVKHHRLSCSLFLLKCYENARRPALTSPVAADVAVDWIFQLLVMSARICLLLMLIGVMGIAPVILWHASEKTQRINFILVFDNKLSFVGKKIEISLKTSNETQRKTQRSRRRRTRLIKKHLPVFVLNAACVCACMCKKRRLSF